MKHVFLLNPVAGTGKFQQGLSDRIAAAAKKLGVEYEIHETTCYGDARDFTAAYEPGTEARFYAIGGDGTLNETVNGIFRRKGYSELALFPCGTGNDFIRVFPNKDLFFDIEKQITAKAHAIDAIGTDRGIYGINMINVGVDADTAAEVHRFSRFFPGTMAYVTSLLNRLRHKLGTVIELTVDEKPPFSEEFILSSVSNGKACGGGFFASPRADLTDGLLEITSVRTLKRRQFFTMVAGYKNGTYLDDPKYAPYIIYQRGKKVTLKTPEPMNICIDGEIFRSDHLTAEILPKAIPFVQPE